MNWDDVDHLAQWAAYECHRQQDVGPLGVADMLAATSYALTHVNHAHATPFNIQTLGFLVDPAKNTPGHWRHTEVTIRGNLLTRASLVPRRMENWVQAWNHDLMSADALYREFEEIHPFVDGNGRAGSILWNLKSGHLPVFRPHAPPNYWSLP